MTTPNENPAVDCPCTFPGCRRANCTDHRIASVNLTTIQVEGVSYRQLDYWARVGHLRPTEPTPGSGIAREWTETEIAVASLMGRLTNAGFDLAVAARVAREHVEHPEDPSVLRGDVLLIVS